MKKRFTALVLALTMTVGVTQGAFAAEPEVITEEQIQAEIQMKTEELLTSVYLQLEAQNALEFMEGYKSILIPEIEYSVFQKYGIKQKQTRMTRQWAFYYGGAISFTDPGTGTEYGRTYYDFNNSYYYILHKNEPPTMADMLLMILGYIPGIGTFFSTIANLKTLGRNVDITSIDEANGYVSVLNAYNPNSHIGSSVVVGWSEHPFAVLADADYYENVQSEFFPQFDPFNPE